MVVHVGGESGVALHDTTGGRSQQVENRGYLAVSGGYCATILINEVGRPKVDTSTLWLSVRGLV